MKRKLHSSNMFYLVLKSLSFLWSNKIEEKNVMWKRSGSRLSGMHSNEVSLYLLLLQANKNNG
jgi:hypothetical protein